jgi:hypothetical protein
MSSPLSAQVVLLPAPPRSGRSCLAAGPSAAGTTCEHDTLSTTLMKPPGTHRSGSQNRRCSIHPPEQSAWVIGRKLCALYDFESSCCLVGFGFTSDSPSLPDRLVGRVVRLTVDLGDVKDNHARIGNSAAGGCASTLLTGYALDLGLCGSATPTQVPPIETVLLPDAEGAGRGF